MPPWVTMPILSSSVSGYPGGQSQWVNSSTGSLGSPNAYGAGTLTESAYNSIPQAIYEDAHVTTPSLVNTDRFTVGVLSQPVDYVMAYRTPVSWMPSRLVNSVWDAALGAYRYYSIAPDYDTSVYEVLGIQTILADGQIHTYTFADAATPPYYGWGDAYAYECFDNFVAGYVSGQGTFSHVTLAPSSGSGGTNGAVEASFIGASASDTLPTWVEMREITNAAPFGAAQQVGSGSSTDPGFYSYGVPTLPSWGATILHHAVSLSYPSALSAVDNGVFTGYDFPAGYRGVGGVIAIGATTDYFEAQSIPIAYNNNDVAVDCSVYAYLYVNYYDPIWRYVPAVSPQYGWGMALN